MDIGYYKAIQSGINADTIQDIQEHEAKRQLLWDLPTSIAFERDVYINGRQQPLIITQTKDEYIYNIEALPNQSFSIGDEIVWQNSHWLVIAKYRGTKYQELGSIEKCNYLLRWQDFKKRIVECWVIVGDEYTRYNRDSATVNQAVDELTLKVPDNEITKSIYIGKRISIGYEYNHLGSPILNVYKIASRRNITLDFDGNNIIRMTMNKDVYNATTDNYTEGICDYQPLDGTAKEISGTTEINGKSKYRLSGNSRTYSATFLNKRGRIDPEAIPEWTIEFDEEYGELISYEVIGGELTINVASTENVLGAVITINVQDAGQLYPEASKQVEVVE